MKNGQTTPSAAVEKISMNLIDPFPNHPFYIFDDNEMTELIESIRKNGLITPIIVRRKGDRYELISGHRRKRAYEYLGYAEIACSVINASDDEAVIMMVDSNCQRTKLLPSERAFAYKMKLEAMKRQGRRTDLTSAQVAQKSSRKPSRQILAEQEGQSQDQIRRYIAGLYRITCRRRGQRRAQCADKHNRRGKQGANSSFSHSLKLLYLQGKIYVKKHLHFYCKCFVLLY